MEPKYFNDYIAAHRLMIKFVKQNEVCPSPIQIHAEKTLVKLRKYLDCCGLRMPAPLFYYSHADERTWAYLPYSDGGSSRTCLKNPNFMHKRK